MKSILDFIIENWAFLSPILLMIAIRLFPTEKDYDLINFIKLLLDKLIPNYGVNNTKFQSGKFTRNGVGERSILHKKEK